MQTIEKINLVGVNSAEEALEKCDCSWTAQEHGLVTLGGIDNNGNQVDGINITSHKALLRSDNNKQLGIVGIDYKALQPHYAFSYFDTILKENDISWTQGVVIDGGSKIILKAQFPKRTLIRVGDECVREIVLINSFDMSSAFTAYFRMERLVCSNGAVSSSKKNKVACRHTENAEFRANTALAMFSQSVKYFEEFEAQCKHLANVVADRQMVNMFLKDMFGDKKTTRTKNQKKAVVKLAKTGMGNDGSSLWDYYNGYTEWVDHERTSNDDKRLVSALIGTGATAKEKAFKSLMKISA